jgi:cytochrome c-type biogenesis protein
MTDVSLFTAGLAGVVSFLSPCVLPLVPGYLSYISGLSYNTLRGETETAGGGAGERKRLLSTVTVHAGAFVLGFTTIFVGLGASATVVGQWLVASGALFTKLAGVVIILFGLHMMGAVKIPLLYREKRLQTRTAPRTLLGSYGVGMAFAFGWTPCIGPILAALLTMAAMQDTVVQGMGLLTVYSLGLGIPFLAAALGINTLLALLTRFYRYFRTVEVVSGGLLIVVGLLVFTNKMTWLSGQLVFLNRFVL